MKVTVASCGTRGDVQPMAALTLRLNAPGHQAVLHAPPENESWAGDLGRPFQALGAPVRGKVFPHMSDQFLSRSQVLKLGLGPNGGLLRMLSTRSLSKAILECPGNERSRRKAEEIAAAIRGTAGVELTVRAVEAVNM